MERYEGQSYKSWSNDCDEMDGGSEGNGCFLFIVLIVFISLIILSSNYPEKDRSTKVKPETECLCTQNK